MAKRKIVDSRGGEGLAPRGQIREDAVVRHLPEAAKSGKLRIRGYWNRAVAPSPSGVRRHAPRKRAISAADYGLIRSGAVEFLCAELLDSPETHLDYVQRALAGALSKDVGA